MGFKSWVGQSGHSVANSAPQVHHLFELHGGVDGPHKLVTCLKRQSNVNSSSSF